MIVERGQDRGPFGASLTKLRAQFDWPLGAAILSLILIGLVNLYSATRVAPGGLYSNQLVFMGLGVIVFLSVAAIDYRVLERLAYPIFGAAIVLLVAVLLGGKTIKGARRWFGIGSVGIQPSELAKLAAVIVLAKALSKERLELALHPWRNLRDAMALLVLPTLLIAKQPDLGTAMILFLIGMTVILLSPLPRYVKLTAIGLNFFAGVLAFLRMAYGYQRTRLLIFLNPDLDPSGAGWHARQALTAVGSGRWFGKGWLRGTQNQLQFLPEHWSDFPFAVWAEEWGFFGCVALIGIYVFLILWALRIARSARDRFAELACLGAAALLFWHTFFNIGMVIGLLPVVGVTLPLVSHGGSSLLTVMAALGLIMNVSIRRTSY